MEIQIPYSLLFTFFCFLLLIHKLSNSKKAIKNLPPGPPKLPLIGNLHNLVGSQPPHHSMRDLAKKYGPIIHLQLGETSNVVITSPELAQEVMKTHDQVFANRPKIFAAEAFAYNSSDIGFSPYGNYWRQLRKICTLELLSVKRVQSFRTIREEEISTFVKYVSQHEGSLINLTKHIFPLTNSIIARAAFGKKTKNVEQILPPIRYVIHLASGLSISDLYPSLGILRYITGMEFKVKKVREDIDRMLENIINDHKAKKVSQTDGEAEEEDLVDVLLRIQKDNNLEIPLTLDNIKAVILDSFIAGTEATATTAEWTLSELLRNPKAMKEVQAEVRRVYGSQGYVDESKIDQLKYLAAAIKENLRLHPPSVLLIPRENSADCEVNGYDIPQKTRVMINAWAMGRDPKYWNEPEKFLPERFLNSSIDFKGTNYEYVPFGGGRRICPGITFATAVVGVVLANLLYHFDWNLPKGMKPEELDMTELFGGSVKRKNSLLVVPYRYRP